MAKLRQHSRRDSRRLPDNITTPLPCNLVDAVMASATLQKALQGAASASQSERPGLYGQILTELTQSSFARSEEQSSSLNAYVDSLFSSSLGIISTRPLLSSLIQFLSSTPSEVKISVGSQIAEALSSQLASYEEQNTAVREILADGYEAEEEWTKAAQTLSGIQLETTQRQVPDLVKVQTNIRILRCYLEDDDTVAAEAALNRIKNSNAAVQVLQTTPELQLHYQLSQARIHDSRRDFLNAAAEYLSVSFSKAVDAEDRLQALSAAIKVSVLAPAGPQRNKMLGRLYKDERAADTQEHSILEKMYLDRLLTADEVEAFAASLSAHQLAKGADGSTVLSRAVTEHNLLAASKLYENISTSALADILNLKSSKDSTAAEKAEDYAARMIEQGRLRAEIDQIDEVIYFENIPGLPFRGGQRDLRLWDHGVQGLVDHVEECSAIVAELFPALAAEIVH